MSVLKQYNESTSQWEAVVIGKQGPSGTLAVTSPLTNSGTSTAAQLGIDYSTFQYGRNYVINGGFDIAQRGTVSIVGGSYSLDRWYVSSWGSASATSVSQQTSGTPAGSRYHMRVTYGASGGYGNMFHYIESANVIPLAGKTMTLSFKVRRSSSWTASSFLSLTVSKNATVDAGPGTSGWSAIFPSLETLTTSIPTGTGINDWLTITTTFTVPNDGSANSLAIQFSEQAVGGAGAYYEIAQVQLEEGTRATPFKRAGGDIQSELALCQRYYVRFKTVDDYAPYMHGFIYNSTTSILMAHLPVTMRAQPYAVDYAVQEIFDYNQNRLAVTGVTMDRQSAGIAQIVATHSGGGGTSGRGCWIRNAANNTGYIGFSAEL